MIYLPKNIWYNIFSYDNTYYDKYKNDVMKELKIYFTNEISKLFFHFFWDISVVKNIQYFEKKFRFMSDLNKVWYTIEFKEIDDNFVFRIHNEKTGIWYDNTSYQIPKKKKKFIF